MIEFKAGDITRNSGDVFAAAAVAPVTITKHSKPRFVVMTIERYKKMSAQADPRRSYAIDELPNDLARTFINKLESDLDDTRG